MRRTMVSIVAFATIGLAAACGTPAAETAPAAPAVSASQAPATTAAPATTTPATPVATATPAPAVDPCKPTITSPRNNAVIDGTKLDVIISVPCPDDHYVYYVLDKTDAYYPGGNAIQIINGAGVSHDKDLGSAGGTEDVQLVLVGADAACAATIENNDKFGPPLPAGCEPLDKVTVTSSR